ncbi:MAG TPA: type II toxin-antitoxin system VapC family toxin [Geminicoccaceae bacterium]|nr:type II toxin-antitoxin system VapC family toxin [Geminicoccaceae bacterium]
MTLVVDASVIGHWLLTTRVPARALAHQFAGGSPLAAPHLLDAEVGHLLRRNVLTGVASLARARIALETFLALPIERYPHATLLPRAFELRDNATFYDALYLALAEALAAPLLTRDRRLARIPGIAAQVQVVANGA